LTAAGKKTNLPPPKGRIETSGRREKGNLLEDTLQGGQTVRKKKIKEQQSAGQMGYSPEGACLPGAVPLNEDKENCAPECSTGKDGIHQPSNVHRNKKGGGLSPLGLL